MWIRSRIFALILIVGTASLQGQSFDGYDYFIVGTKKDTIFRGVIYCTKNEIKPMLTTIYSKNIPTVFTIRYRKNKNKKENFKYATLSK